MPCGLELLGGILNIVQIIDVIFQHVQGFRRIEGMLKDAESKARKIEANLQRIDPLYALEGVQAEILEDAVRDFEEIHHKLVKIQGKLANSSVGRQFLNSTEIVEQLNEICKRLTKRDDILKLVTMIGALNVELRIHCTRIVALLQELNSKTPDTASVETQLKHICQLKMVEDCVREITVRRKGYRTDQMTAHVHFSNGVNLYNGSYGLKSYEIAAQHFHAAEKLGWSRAYYYLGMLYKNGKGVELCNVSAKKYFQLGTDAGDPAAITQLGICYDEGIGGDRSSEKSTALIKRGAEQGDPYGMGYYAWCKISGHNTDVNLALAFNFSLKAVKKNYAQSELARCYQQGIHVDRDPRKAVKLYTEAIDVGTSWNARLPLALCYEEGMGVEVNLEKAAGIYKEGTALLTWQRPYFQGYYGMCLIRGRGVPQDIEKGWAEIRKSIQGSNANGWFVKGECYRHGYGIEPDLAQAVICYRHASQMKNGADGKIAARFALGNMFEMGEGGVGLDMTQAYDHYAYAANRMHRTAQWKMGVFCESGIGVDRFEQRAVHYFRLAANSGHREAQIKASKYYMKGKGVSRNLHSAVQILRPAAESGNKEAKRLLRHIQIRIFLRRQSHSPVQSEPTLEKSSWILLEN